MSIFPTNPPPLKRSDSLDLLSPTQSVAGSLNTAYDSATFSSDDDDADYSAISRQVAAGPSLASTSPASNGSGSRASNGSMRSQRSKYRRESQQDAFGGRRLPQILSNSQFPRSSINRSEYRYLHARMDDDYLADDDEYEDDRRSQQSDFLHGSISHRRRYVYSFIALIFVLVTFVVQTEAATYIAQDLHYQKPILVLYLTHSSWTFLFPLQILFLWLLSPRHTLREIYVKHRRIISSTLDVIAIHNQAKGSPPMYLLKSVAVLTAIMTIAASSWYIAVNITTPSDVTAIYNCSAFFAYAFSVVLLREKVTKLKSFSVILAIIGVMVVAYGDTLMRPLSPLHGASVDAADAESNRLLGNIIIGIGAVLYGLYEVVYKRYLCPPKSVSARRSALFANVVGATVGIVSFFTVWILLPILSYFDLESFELPTGDVLFYLIISIIANMLFSGSFLILMSLTSPVLSSVAALLTIFLVAITDWLIFDTPLTPGSVLGGGIIGFAFILLAGASWKEIGAYDEEPLTITDEEIARAEAERQRLLRQNDRWLARENNVESAAGEA